MDRQQLALLMPLLALTIGLAATVLNGLVKLQRERSKQGRTIADEGVTARLEAVEQEVGALREQLAEAHERLDFAERLLARPPEERGAGRRSLEGA
ncbi:MAG: hypothetical protein ACREMR_10555 [Gemmatimonadales bacterium]